MLEQEKQSDATEPPRGVAAETKPVDGSDKASSWTTAHEIQQVALLRLLEAHQYERVRKRRWSILFRSLFFLLLLLFWYEWRSVSGHEVAKPERHTALIDIQGEIDHESDANADQITSALRAAFDDKATAGVILRLNSPGGSPVQASIIHQEILRLRAKHPTIPIHTVIEDICASGGYYIAAASDRIYVDPNSLVGSMALRLALAKARAVACDYPDALVIGSDQAATLDGSVAIGKPGNRQAAIEQLSAASGKLMQFFTALAVVRQTQGSQCVFEQCQVVETQVRFRTLSAAQIQHYVDREPAFDCAGAAKCEGLGISLMASIQSEDPTALIGLP
ncbi:MAG: hypothetical protein EBX67_12550, partial [Betaproteobacteria bacterium]|nr:hypothetical protein [Betaproteobacteria bacterium]